MSAANKRLQAAIERELRKKYPLEPGGKVSNLDHLVARMTQLATCGQAPWATLFLIERWAGRVPQAVTGADGGPIQVTPVYRFEDSGKVSKASAR